MVWNESTERAMMLCMIEHGGASQPKWDEISNMMGQDEFTASACRWSPENERAMLLLAITDADTKPSKTTWELVASKLGGDLNANAVSQRFYKLKRESEKVINGNGNSAPATPSSNKSKAPKTPGTGKSTGRKRKNDSADSNEDTPTTKRTPTKKKAAPKSVVDAQDDDDDNEVKEQLNGEQTAAKAEDEVEIVGDEKSEEA